MRLTLLWLLLAVLLAVGCRPTDAPAAPTPTAPQVPTVDFLRDAEDLREVIEGLRGSTVLVNFWATWCPPCVEEFPHLMRLQRDYQAQRLVVVTVSFDDPEGLETTVRPFLEQHGVARHAYLLKVRDDRVFRQDFAPEWSGALPATFVYEPDGELVERREGKTEYEQFIPLVAPHLSED